MKKLDDLDTYTRTQIKNEIATERVNYVTAQRTAIEKGLNEKIDQKPTLQAIKNEYDPIIAKINSNFKYLGLEIFDCKIIHKSSSIISSSD
jgi:FKBP-type peptidyl-prolyl cis-trans isomerase (trigger factor)